MKAVEELKDITVLSMLIIKDIQDGEEVQDIQGVGDSTPTAEVDVGMRGRKRKKKKRRRTNEENVEAEKVASFRVSDITRRGSKRQR